MIVSEADLHARQQRCGQICFTHLVDAFYDIHVKLVLSATTPIVDLYEGERLRAEFSRTESRLIEMQSQAYLGA